MSATHNLTRNPYHFIDHADGSSMTTIFWLNHRYTVHVSANGERFRFSVTDLRTGDISTGIARPIVMGAGRENGKLLAALSIKSIIDTDYPFTER